MPESLHELARLARRCTISDARILRRRLSDLRRDGPAATDPARLARIHESLLAAVARREARAASVPKVTYPEGLPVSAARDRIVGHLKAARALVVCGETGSGKSTQLPKMCLEAGRGVAGLIGHTQPRRIAARSVAARLATELGVELGSLVGFQTRFDARQSPETLVKVMTDGILLAETRRDRGLHRYDTVIVDEAHERSLNIDFLLGHLRRLLDRRDDLTVVVTSATIEAERIAGFLGNAPVVEVSGRGFPIETRFRDPDRTPLEPDDEDPRFLEALVEALEEIERTPAAGGGPRDTLVFLSGERAIREATELVQGRFPGADVLPLHGRLPAAEQDRVFAPGRARRIVLATNVAETSLTVPGIDAVVDGGLARISRFSARAGVQRLPIEPIARSSAEQRKGRAGRTAPGLCLRLYSEADFLARPAFTPPEIRRTNLASVILQMLGAGLGRPEEFPFLDPPSPGLVAAGYRTLFMLGAVDLRNGLTPLGRRLARLPVDPRIGRIALAGIDERCPEEAIVIAAALSVQDPRERPAERAGAADLAHAAFRDPDSDFLGWIRLWKAWREASGSLGSSALRRWCRDRFLSPSRLREWTEVHRQLRSLVHERILPIESRLAETPDEAAVHRAVLAGLVGNVARRGEKHGEWRTAAGIEVFLHPSSTLVRRNPTWIVAAEIVETSRRFARTVGRIQPDWIERIAPQLCERSVSEPHWVEANGQVAAWERVSFGGLTLIPRRRVAYGPIDPDGSRNIFLHALVAGRVRTDGAFLAHNRDLRERIERLEERRRRRGLLVDEEARFAFYERSVPAEIHSGPSFERWRRRVEADSPRVLFMGLGDLLLPGAEMPDEARLPDRLESGGSSFELAYRHEPGTPRDGIAVRVPAAVAGWLDVRRLDWLVPGRLAEKVEALIRALPKRIRTRFQPAAEYAAGAAEAIPFGEGELLPQLARHLAAVGGIEVFPRDFDLAAVPEHLKMLVEVIGDDGTVVASGRDAAAIAARFRPGAERTLAEAAAAGEFGEAVARLADRELDDLDVEPLPERVPFLRHGTRVEVHPALECGGAGSVRLALLHDPAAARRSHAAAIRRLLALRGGEALRHHVEYLPAIEAMERAFAPLGPPSRLREIVADAAVAAALGESREPMPRDAVTLAGLSRRLEAGWFRAVQLAGERIGPALESFAAITTGLEGPHPAGWADAVEDLRREAGRLVRSGLLDPGAATRMGHLPRRLAALRSRLRRLPGGLERDRSLRAERDARLARFEVLVAAGLDSDRAAEISELLEEFRVHLLAGDIRTAFPAGTARVDEALRSAEASLGRG